LFTNNKSQITNHKNKISAILLAAGLSRRMGEDKLLLEYRGKSLLQYSVDLLYDLPVYEKIVVTTKARLDSITLPPGIKVVVNRCPETGQSGSIRLGIEHSTGTHYFFIPADQSRLTTDDLIPLLGSANANPDKIIFPTIGSEPCSPTLFPKRFRGQLLDLSGDTGGRKVRQANPESCHAIKPENPKNFMDIDNMEEYRELRVEN